MMKAMGLNAITTYVFWNYHEESPGKWNWSGEKDLKKFIKTAQEVGLYVIIRPGPYVCAEWEFGGYPWWLQNIKGLKIREDNDQFLAETQKYITQLYNQAENEFGSFVVQRKRDIPLASHRAYNAKITVQDYLKEEVLQELLPTANGLKIIIKNLKKAVKKYNNNRGPYMVAEFYPGWLAHWAEKFPRVDAGTVARQTDKYLKNDVSFNFYMVHGGTNFGFTSGANYDKNHDIQPDLTSYDYDAPITEAGWRTPKYDSLRAVISRHTKARLPEVPAPIKVIDINIINLNRLYNLLQLCRRNSRFEGDKPLSFEELNQGHGYVLYRRHFNQPVSALLDLKGLRDYATIYINGEKAIEKAGYKPGVDIMLALDCASSEFYKDGIYDYRKFEGDKGAHRTREEQVSYLAELCNKYPIISIEDGMQEDDWEGWKMLTDKIGDRVQLVGDDLFVTNVKRLKKGIDEGIANSILVKVNQIGSLSETMAAVQMAQNNRYTTVMSHRSGETEDATIADLAVARIAGQIKTGSLHVQTEMAVMYTKISKTSL
ncbi:hypothetical protein FQR65_LT18627 [Abscondita terminalis]|nr:hypothetical protein FQR65_LT18627 [Abscondita terminalis]